MTTEPSYQQDLEFVIAQTLAHDKPHSKITADGDEVYAYPHADGVAWGVNDGRTSFNVKRGIRKNDGTDIGVM